MYLFTCKSVKIKKKPRFVSFVALAMFQCPGLAAATLARADGTFPFSQIVPLGPSRVALGLVITSNCNPTSRLWAPQTLPSTSWLSIHFCLVPELCQSWDPSDSLGSLPFTAPLPASLSLSSLFTLGKFPGQTLESLATHSQLHLPCFPMPDEPVPMARPYSPRPLPALTSRTGVEEHTAVLTVFNA